MVDVWQTSRATFADWSKWAKDLGEVLLTARKLWAIPFLFILSGYPHLTRAGYEILVDK